MHNYGTFVLTSIPSILLLKFKISVWQIKCLTTIPFAMADHTLKTIISFTFSHLATGDYDSKVEDITLSSSSTSVTVNVITNDDSIDEINETFTADLTLKNANDRVTVNPSSAEVFIIDNDGE